MKNLLPKPFSGADPRQDPSPLSPLASTQHGPRKRSSAVKAACQTCRASRSKCDGERPACARCTARGYDCHYDVQQGLTRQRDLRNKYELAKLERDKLQSIFEQLRTIDVADAHSLLDTLRESNELFALQPDDNRVAVLSSENSQNQSISPRSNSLATDEAPVSASSSMPSLGLWPQKQDSLEDEERAQTSPDEEGSHGEPLSTRSVQGAFWSDRSDWHDAESSARASKGDKGKQKQDGPRHVDPSLLRSSVTSISSTSRAKTPGNVQSKPPTVAQAQTLPVVPNFTGGEATDSWPSAVQVTSVSRTIAVVHMSTPLYLQIDPNSTNVGHIMSYWLTVFVDRARHRISLHPGPHTLLEVLGPPNPSSTGIFTRSTNFLLSDAEDVQTWAKLCLQEVQGLQPVEYCASFLMLTWYVRWLIFPCHETYRNIPPYLRPSTLQSLVPHLPIYQLVPWASLREYLIEYPSDIVTTLANNLSINWPHSVSDMFSNEPGTSKDSFSSSFLEHVRNLGSWSLSSAVLLSHPHWAKLATFKDP